MMWAGDATCNSVITTICRNGSNDTLIKVLQQFRAIDKEMGKNKLLLSIYIHIIRNYNVSHATKVESIETHTPLVHSHFRRYMSSNNYL